MVSCSQKTTEGSINIEFNSALDFSEWITGKTVELTPLETNSNSLIGDFNNLKVVNEELFIFSMSEKYIYRFSKNGQFINRIGAIGNGSGEYRNPSSFMVNQDTVAILCNYGNDSRIYKYTINGDYSNYSTINNSQFYDLEQLESTVFYSTSASDVDYRVAKITKNKPKGIINTSLNKSMTIQETNFSKNKSQLLYHDSFDNKVYKINKDSAWISHQLNFGRYNLKASYFEGQDLYQNFDKMMKNGIATVNSYFESNDATYIGLAKQSQEGSEFFQLIIDNSGTHTLVEGPSGRLPVFLIENNKLVLLIHAGNLIEAVDEFSTSKNFENLKKHVSKLSIEDNPVLLKISLD